MRYLIFAGEDYYPKGGGLDLRGGHDELKKVQEKAAEMVKPTKNKWGTDCYEFDWLHILDTETGKIEKVFGYKNDDEDDIYNEERIISDLALMQK